MGIVTLARQMREIGRIRTGIQVEYQKAGQTRQRPAKLETFRLTSSSKEAIDAAAELLGGAVVPWTPREGAEPQWEVVTAAKSLDIIVPPGAPVTAWYEMWSGGGCERRCDGETMVLTMEPCLCPADVAKRLELAQKGEACKATTRLSVMLPALPDLGVWRLESHGYYAAVELAGAADVLALATERGQLIRARLRLEQREKRIPGKPTQKYAVPIIEFVETRMADLLGSGPMGPLLGPGETRVPELPSTTLPASSDFRGPSQPEAPRPPQTAQPPDVPAENGNAQDAPAGAPPGDADGAPGMTQPELQAVLNELGVSIDAALARAKALWPTWTRADGPLTPAQRIQLADVLRSEAAAAVL